MHKEIVIIGGGLAGLSLARSLHQQGRSFALIEGRSRLGGRVLSRGGGQKEPDGQRIENERYDLGPAWFWPHQARMGRLLDELGLRRFEQFATGRLVLQEQDGSVRRDLDFATMAGALRVEGGFGRLIDEMSKRLPETSILAGHRVTHLKRLSQDADHEIVVRGDTDGNAFELSANIAVLALPPRVAQHTIDFGTDLDADETAALSAMPTWMASHAKLVAAYPQPFWRHDGLSGDGISRRGPLAEIHDATPYSAATGALFGFVSCPPGSAERQADRLIERSVEQLGAMFGEAARQPQQVMLMDWARESFTASPADREQPAGHSPYTPSPAFSKLWNGRLIFASSEMSASDWGLLEGALDAAESAHRQIQEFPMATRF